MPDDESQISTVPSTSDGHLRLFLNGGFAAFNLRHERYAEGPKAAAARRRLAPRSLYESHCAFTLALYKASELGLRHAYRLRSGLGPVFRFRLGEAQPVAVSISDAPGKRAKQKPLKLCQSPLEAAGGDHGPFNESCVYGGRVLSTHGVERKRQEAAARRKKLQW